jgi:hypothetical protein
MMDDLKYLNRTVNDAGYLNIATSEADVPDALSEAMDEKIRTLLFGGSVANVPAELPEKVPIQKFRFRIAKAAMAIAAAILMVVSIYVFIETRPLLVVGSVEFEYSEQQLRSVAKPDQYRIKLVLDAPGYIYVLNLDSQAIYSFIYPYLKEEGWNTLDIEGPFREEEQILIPPKEKGYSGYGFEKKENMGVFFLIPSRDSLSENDLRALLAEIESERIGEEQTMNELIKSTETRLKKRFPGTSIVAPSEY